MNTYTLKMFNTGQITLPKKWRSKYKTKHFVAKETKNGLLIEPISKDEVVYYENEDGCGLYCESGLDIDAIQEAIRKLNKED
jgi:bifunctional DNA-binding transcriptional regulator/antitoxin component of YhaV-PrlF toxin-antitoxin module